MNKRTVSIIYELCDQEKVITIAELSERFQVSQRTIRNDLNAINTLLRENGFQELKLKSGGQILREEGFQEIRLLVADGDFYTYKLSKEERKRIASALLIASTEYITLSSIADTLYVSRATVIHDLEEIKAFIRSGNLEVRSHPNKGLRVEGKESEKRYFLMRLVNGRTDSNEQDVVSRHISIQAGDRIVLQKILSEQEQLHEMYLTDSSFQKLLLYLGIMVNRNLQGEYVEVQERTENGKYRLAQDILKYVSQYCHINTTEDEVQFLSTILSSSRYMKQKSTEKNVLKIQLVTRQFIERISDELGMNLNGDYDFFENLSHHLESVFTPIPPNYPDSSVLDEVMEDNPEVIQAVQKQLPLLRSWAGREMTHVEMQYIAVHVCAAIERKKNKEIAFHVIVACHAGIGTSQLLLEKLKMHFNFQIVDILSSHAARNLEKGSADFIISTVPLTGCQLDYVVVSPILTDEDYIRVGNKIDALRNSRNLPSRVGEDEFSAKELLERITPVLYEMVPAEAPLLTKKIRRIVRDYFKQPVEAETDVFSPYLHHLLPETHIQLDIECADWQDAVRQSAQKLLKLGYIEEHYVEAMIENIQENGPYIVLSEGFAVPHEGLEKGSIKMGMNLIRLKRPVPFGAEELDPVEFVCCLSAVDHKTHLKAFFNLVNMLKEPSFKQELRECRTSQEAAMVIEKYEYEICN